MSNDQPSTPRTPPEGGERKYVSEWGRYAGLAFELLGFLGVMGYAGWYIDEKYKGTGYGLFAGLMLGLAAWIYRVLRVTRNMFK